MRNAIAIFLILCANIVLLAHVMIPHHHHDNIACFVLPVEEEHDNCCDHETDHKAQHESNTDDDCCILNDILAIIPDGYKQDNQHLEFKCQEIIIGLEAFDLVSLEENTSNIKFLNAFREKPYLENSYGVFATQSLGLRAPPIC